MSASDKSLRDGSAGRMGEISHAIRQVVQGSLPGQDDQFLTLMVPGKDLDIWVSRLKGKITTGNIDGHCIIGIRSRF